jgi:transposase
MRVEVLGAERRRHWRYEDKVRIVEETMQPGAVVCDVARRHGLSQSLVFTWRRLAREGRLGGESAGELVPVEITPIVPPSAEAGGAATRPRRKSGIIEIELGNDRRVRVDRDVDADALRRVLEALGVR